MTRYLLPLMAVLTGLILAGCASARIFTPATATATPKFFPTATEPLAPLSPSATPASSASPTPGQKAYQYKTIYQAGGFSIRQAFLGTDAIWKDDFQMPQARIENSVQSLGLGRGMDCLTQSKGAGPCRQTLQLSLANGTTDTYELRVDSLQGGAGTLIKNGRLIWSGVMNGAGAFAILSSRRIGDEIAFDYSKSNWGSGDPNVWVSDSILLTKGKSVVLIPNAFAPYPIQDQLIYFRVKTRLAILVFDGQEVGDTYDDVLDPLCCWGGPPIQMAADGQMIDFFAQKGRDWYHVQAGYLGQAK